MRTLVNSVLASLPRLANVFGMGVFLLMIFGIMGIQFWGGVVRRHGWLKIFAPVGYQSRAEFM